MKTDYTKIDPDFDSRAAVMASPSLAGAWPAFLKTPITKRAKILQDVGENRFGVKFLDDLVKLQDGRDFSFDELLASAYVFGRAEATAGIQFDGSASKTRILDLPTNVPHDMPAKVPADPVIPEGQLAHEMIFESKEPKHRALLAKFNAEPDAAKRGAIFEEMRKLSR